MLLCTHSKNCNHHATDIIDRYQGISCVREKHSFHLHTNTNTYTNTFDKFFEFLRRPNTEICSNLKETLKAYNYFNMIYILQ